ncbi:hypothetical protein CPB86DRAFT_778963 [Serendipita vermifera]|nr:hypothetical protein CPB86DRAFT_778963 [Serendipita vermifera]
MNGDLSSLTKAELVAKVNELLTKNDFSHQNLIHMIHEMQDALETQRRANNKLVDIFRISLITDQIISYLSFRDMIGFFQVCKATRQWKGSKLNIMVQGLLRRYVSKPVGLLDTMRETGSIISGSSVLWLVDGMNRAWTPGDLDIYAPEGMTRHMIQFLHEDGYTTVLGGQFNNPYLKFNHLHSVTKLKNGDASIDVMESSNSSAIHPLTAFHVTAVMNYLTADSITMLYPKLTFSRLAVRHFATDRIGTTGWEPKYEDRLFLIRTSRFVPPKYQRTICTALDRRPEDRYSLSVYFHDRLDTSPPMDCPTWKFISIEAHHHRCTNELCQVAHYYHHPADNVSMDVIADATVNLMEQMIRQRRIQFSPYGGIESREAIVERIVTRIRDASSTSLFGSAQISLHGGLTL